MSGVPTPKDRFTSLDTLALVRELRALRHARVDKAFDLPGGGWSLTLRVPQEGRRELLLVPGRFAALLSESATHADELSPFAKELRRLLEGAVVEEVPEPGGERFLEMVLRRSDSPEATLVALEMFGAGNLVVARGSKIAAVAQTRRWAHRTVAVGSEYARPPVRTDPWTVGVAEIEAELSRSRTDLASTLAARLALGGPLAEEVIARGGWDGAAAASSGSGQVGPELHRVLQLLLLEVGERPSGFLYQRNGIAVDATPYRSHRWRDVADVVEVVRPTFSAAVMEVLPFPRSRPRFGRRAGTLEGRQGPRASARRTAGRRPRARAWLRPSRPRARPPPTATQPNDSTVDMAGIKFPLSLAREVFGLLLHRAALRPPWPVKFGLLLPRAAPTLPPSAAHA